MTVRKFDISSGDAQGTPVEPIAAERFDFDAYAAYEAEKLSVCRDFWESASGVAVYRRFRVPEVYCYGCRDMRRSLELQLAALAASMNYTADIPNYLEPWYGIGAVAGGFGGEYLWPDGQAPVVEPPFNTLKEALAHEPLPVAKTPVGRHTLEMIEYFLEAAGGRLPMSLTDTQSPWNTAMMLAPSAALLIETLSDPEGVRTLINRSAALLDEFNRLQIELIGDALVYPGHGFAASRVFRGLGISGDNMCMISPKSYSELCAEMDSRVGEPFGGTAFHSCGNWSKWIPAVRRIAGLLAVDGAFSPQTDPDPNPPQAFAEAFAGSGVTVNARIVGDADEVARVTGQLWRPGMKLIVVTYCRTPEEQAEAYDRVHEICS